jgi:hypothetical protein
MRPSVRWSNSLSSLVLALIAATTIDAQSTRPVTARLVPASRVELPARIDSSNPAVWSLIDGVNRLFVISSWGGVPVRSVGDSLVCEPSRSRRLVRSDRPGRR